MELDPSFVDLIHNDSGPGSDEVWQVAEQVLAGPAPPGVDLERGPPGGAWGRGKVRCTGCGPRTYPTDADAEGYTYWHRDTAR
eukprot:SAG22_NODE_15728_length_342_cov_0.839506_1_plen_82_part_01